MKRLVPLLLSGVILALAPVSSAVPGVEHIVVIGSDGMGSLAFKETNAPVMHRLMKEGAYTLRARGVMPTSSSPNWASMIMGAGPEQHGVTSNDWLTNKFEIPALEVGPEGMFPTIFRVVREQKPDAHIACLHDWDGFGRLLERGMVNHVEHVKDAIETAGKAAKYLKEHKPQFLFIHFDGVDHAGHAFGWKSPTYFKSVELVDSLIGDVVQAIDEAGMGGKTLVLISADHGGVGTKHGGDTIAELEIPWIVYGPGVAKGTVIHQPVNTYDTAATLAWVLGLKAPAAWIGRPVTEAFAP
ncbi:MAG: alkaline phosphatase [Verrucomicrobia bacterium]|nr:alkaline phosphatase [Verrucomicrobiota bacterium]